MFVTFIDGVTLGWLPDRNDEQARAAIDGFAELLSGLAEPALATAG
jgi:hypothetical protein